MKVSVLTQREYQPGGVILNEYLTASLLLPNGGHITVLGRSAGRRLQEKLGLDLSEPSARLDLIEFLELASSVKIGLRDEFYFLRKTYDDGETRASVIQMVETDIIQRLYDHLGFDEEPPEPHITVCKSGEMGIGLSCKGELEKYVISFWGSDGCSIGSRVTTLFTGGSAVSLAGRVQSHEPLVDMPDV